MKQKQWDKFCKRITNWLEENEFHYKVLCENFDEDLAILNFSVKEIPLVRFGFWYMCFPHKDGRQSDTPQPFFFAEFEYEIDKFKPTRTAYSPSYHMWLETDKYATEDDALEWLNDLYVFMKEPWLLYECVDADVDLYNVEDVYLHRLGRRTLSRLYDQWIGYGKYEEI